MENRKQEGAPPLGLCEPQQTRVLGSVLGIYLGRKPGHRAVWGSGTRGPGMRREIRMFSPSKQTSMQIGVTILLQSHMRQAFFHMPISKDRQYFGAWFANEESEA